MASTASFKSDTPHSFSLPRFRWTSTNHHSNSTVSQSTSDNAELSVNVRIADSLSTPASPPSSSSSSPSHFSIPKSLDKSASSSDRGKIRLKIRYGRSNPEDVAATQASVSLVPDQAEQSKPRIWNLRTRKASTKKLNDDGSAPEVPIPSLQGMKTRSARSLLRVASTPSKIVSQTSRLAEKKKKIILSIPLSKDDIAEDVFALTGKKPCTRPKKRAKNEQRQLDVI